ncbi:Nck-associated protein 1 [Ochromonadaceae sp. CCMP2298]|nr:Nck-associated protein 1 [Ochromonadaceae sp. CCMP2298]
MAGAVVDQLQGAYSLLLDVADFCTRAREAMRVLLTDTVEFKLSQNRCLIHLYLDTLVVYIRVLKLTQMLDDRAALAALYAAAYGVLHQAELSSAPAAAAFQHSTSCVAALLHATADNARHLIDTFAPQVDHFKTLLMTLRPSLCLLQNPEDLRRNYILNPITGGDNMGAPAIEPLSASLDVPALSELQQLDRTYEHTAYSFLAYPALLLQPDAFELLGLLGRGRLSVVLWRDISLSFHVELEKISQSFPLPADGIQLKSLLKAASRTSVAEAGQQMRFRRSYLEAELATLTSLLCAVPGLMGPKLPTLLAACSLARGEVCAYFRHAEGTTLRRDSRAHFRAAQYAAEDVGLLMHLLGVAAGLINTHRGIISAYYGEYLCANDLTVVGRLIGECGDALDTARPLFDAVLRDLDQLGKSPTTWARPSHLSHSEGGSGVDAVGGLAAFRFNWQCAVAICCSQQCSAGRRACAPFALLAARMQYATERSTYKDSLTRLLDECVHLTPAGWYRAALLSSFSATLADPHLGAAHSFAFFSPLQHALQSCHPDCPAEVPELSQKAGVIANTMMADLAAFAVTLVKFLWDNISALERQHQPLEVAKRIERSLKKGAGTGGPAPAEVLPGCESEVWAKHLIERFVLIQQHLTWIMAAARTKGAFIVHDVEYVPALYLQEQIVVFFQQRLQELMSSMVNVDGMGGGVGTGEEVGGPGTLGFGQLLHKLTCGFRSMQYVLRFVGTDVGSGVRGVFAWETRADGTSPIGVPLTLFQELDGTRLIGRVAEFVSLLTLQVAKEGSGLVWSPVQGAFVNRGMEQGGGGLHGDRLLNPYELRQLVIIVGVQGVRAIESRLLSIVADQFYL